MVKKLILCFDGICNEPEDATPGEEGDNKGVGA
jgi:hypothetical protein